MKLHPSNVPRIVFCSARKAWTRKERRKKRWKREREREREDLVQKMVTREKTRLVTKNTPRKDMPCFLSFFFFFFFSKRARVRTSFCIRRYANEVRENVAKLIECKLDYIIWIRSWMIDCIVANDWRINTVNSRSEYDGIGR